MPIPVNLVFEDEISEFTMIKLLDSFEDKYFCGYSYPGNGFGYIKSNINGFNQGFSNFTGVSLANFPLNPDIEANPKQTLINITRKSRRRTIREDIVPINENAQIGPNYNEQLMNYVASMWDIERAMGNSESLRRAYRYLEEFEYNIPNNK